jgi:hypothetical protein
VPSRPVPARMEGRAIEAGSRRRARTGTPSRRVRARRSRLAPPPLRASPLGTPSLRLSGGFGFFPVSANDSEGGRDGLERSRPALVARTAGMTARGGGFGWNASVLLPRWGPAQAEAGVSEVRSVLAFSSRPGEARSEGPRPARCARGGACRERLLAAKVRQTADQAEGHVNWMTPRELGSRSMRDARLAGRLRPRAWPSISPTMTSLQVQDELFRLCPHLNEAYI